MSSRMLATGCLLLAVALASQHASAVSTAEKPSRPAAKDSEKKSPPAPAAPTGESSENEAASEGEHEPSKTDLRFDLDALLKTTDTAPIVFPKTSITIHEYRLKKLAWLKSTLHSAIDRELNGQLSDPAKAEAADRLLSWWVGLEPDISVNDALKVAELAAPTAKAAVLQTFLGELVFGAGRPAEGKARMRLAVEQFDVAKEPAFVGVLAAGILWNHDPTAREDARINARFEELLKAALTPEQCTEENAPFIVHFLSTCNRDFAFKPRPQRVLPILAEAKIPRWAQLSLLGQSEVDAAWKARGGGWAATVTEEGWQGYAMHLGRAREVLTESWKLRPESPEAATAMIGVAMGGATPDEENMRVWFDRASAPICNSGTPYEKMRWGLRPRWGGKLSTMLAFGVACAQSNRPDADVGIELSQALYDIANETGILEPLFQNPKVAGLVVKTRSLAVEHAVSDKSRRDALGFLALDAWLCADYATSASAFERLANGHDAPLPKGAIHQARVFQVDFGDVARRAPLLASSWGGAYLRAEAARNSGDFETAAKLSAELLKKAGGESERYPDMSGLVSLTSFEASLSQPGWHQAAMDALVWRAPSGHWDIGQNVLRSTLAGNTMGHCFLYASLGDRYEMRGQIKLPVSSPLWSWGFYIGNRVFVPSGIEFMFNTHDHRAILCMLGPGQELAKHKLPAKITVPENGKFPFRLRRDGNQLSIWIADQVVVENAPVPDNAGAGRTGFGLTAGCGSEKDPVVFSEVEFRRLPKE